MLAVRGGSKTTDNKDIFDDCQTMSALLQLNNSDAQCRSKLAVATAPDTLVRSLNSKDFCKDLCDMSVESQRLEPTERSAQA